MPDNLVPLNDQSLSSPENALVAELSKGKGKKYTKLTMAVLGSLPWVGSFINIMASLGGAVFDFADGDQDKINDLQRLWMKEHQEKITLLSFVLKDMFFRLDSFGEEIQERIESPEYLSLVRSAFRSWDQVETEEKRQMIKRLITNAGATKLCPDDLVRLFIKWIDEYHESHFAVIKEIYQHRGSTRGQIWDRVHTERPREDSSEADLFRYLIRDLSTGGVIRIERETTSDGQFLRKTPSPQSRGSLSTVMESAFEDSKPYTLTELGEKFIHYVLSDVVTRIE
ncbi:hypothetical protein HYS97_03025 [Candidatus Daviesbacteria bacterium]|nr:hypothetical protein [Candidatus Daviesbacteria bacterium]